MDGDAAAGAEAMRDLNEIRSFLSSGAVATPLDAVCAPVLLAVMFLLHPAFGWLGVAGIALLTIVGIVSDLLARPATIMAAEERSRAGNQLAAGLREPELIEGLGMFPALVRRWAHRQAEALEAMRRAGERSRKLSAIVKIARLVMQAGVITLGVLLVLSRQASPGSLMGANLLLGKVLGPFDALVSSWRRWIEAGAAWGRIAALLSCAPGVSADTDTVTGETGLVLHEASFREPKSGRVLLRDISCACLPGRRRR
jgi:ATP-binding cassette subfamily C protein